MKQGAWNSKVIINEDGTRAEIVNPAIRAHKLRLSGKPWAEIAAECGYSNPYNAQNAVRRMLAKTASELDARHRRAQLLLEVQRLDAMQHAYWDEAMGGNVFAAQLVLKCIESRVKYLRLTDEEVTADATVAALVIGGTRDQYLAGLKRIVEISNKGAEQEAG